MLKLGKQKAEIQRPALSIPPLLISAFCFPSFSFLLRVFPPSLFISSDRA